MCQGFRTTLIEFLDTAMYILQSFLPYLPLNLAQTWLLSIKKVSASREVSLEVSRLIKEDIVVVVDWLLKVKVAYQCSSFLLSHPKVP